MLRLGVGSEKPVPEIAALDTHLRAAPPAIGGVDAAEDSKS